MPATDQEKQIVFNEEIVSFYSFYAICRDHVVA